MTEPDIQSAYAVVLSEMGYKPTKSGYGYWWGPGVPGDREPLLPDQIDAIMLALAADLGEKP